MHELGFVDAEALDQSDERRHGGFAHADGAELFGFDDLDLAQFRLQVLREHGCRQPPGGAAADDHDFRKGLHHQFRFSTITPGASWEWAVL